MTDGTRANAYARTARRYGHLRAQVERVITRIALVRFVAFTAAALTG